MELSGFVIISKYKKKSSWTHTNVERETGNKKKRRVRALYVCVLFAYIDVDLKTKFALVKAYRMGDGSYSGVYTSFLGAKEKKEVLEMFPHRRRGSKRSRLAIVWSRVVADPFLPILDSVTKGFPTD